jgi:hypothetical protein
MISNIAGIVSAAAFYLVKANVEGTNIAFKKGASCKLLLLKI